MSYKILESGSKRFSKHVFATSVLDREFEDDEASKKFLGVSNEPRLKLIDDYLEKFNSVSISEVDFADVSGLTANSIPVLFNSYLDFTPATIDKIETGFDNLNQLAIYFADPDVRKSIEEAIADSEFIEELISSVVNAGNRNIRLGSPLVEFRSIFDAVSATRVRLSNGEAKQVMIFLLRSAFKKWDLLYQDKTVIRLNLRKRTNVTSTITTEINVAFAEKALSNLSFESINGDNRGYTTAGILATSFQNSLEKLRHAIIAMTQNDLALSCLMPRLKSYLLRDMSSYTKEQMTSFTNATFLSLAGNATIAMLALDEHVPMTTTVPELYWANYDELLLSVLQTSSVVKWCALSRILNKYSLQVIRDYTNKRKYVVVSRNIKSQDKLNSYYRMKAGSFDEYVAFNSVDKITSIFTEWSNKITSYTINELASNVLSSFTYTDEKEKICLIGCDVNDEADNFTDMELKLLAMALADSIRIRKLDHSGSIEFLIDVYKDSDTSTEFKDLPRQLVTTNVKTVLFTKAKNHKGEDFDIADLSLELLPGKKYHQSAYMVQSNFSREIPLRLSYLKRDTTGEILRFTDFITFSELFQLDIPEYISQEKPFVSSLIMSLLFKTRDVIYDSLIQRGVTTEQEFLLSTKVSRSFGNIWGQLIDNNELRMISDHVLGIYEAEYSKLGRKSLTYNPVTKDWTTSTGSSLLKESKGWRYNITIKDKITFDVIYYLLQVYGFVSINDALAYGDDMIVLMSYYIADKHML